MKAFQPFRLDTINRSLWRADERLPLTPKAFDVLSYLVEHRARLVTHDEILEAVWTDTYVNPEVVKKPSSKSGGSSATGRIGRHSLKRCGNGDISSSRPSQIPERLCIWNRTPFPTEESLDARPRSPEWTPVSIAHWPGNAR